jgi:Tfp pilus assembly protein PilX
MDVAANCHHTLWRRLRAKLERQDGIALVAALGISVVLTMMGATAIAYGTSNAGTAARGTADQKAYAAAEAGLNNMMSVLSAPGVDAQDPRALCLDAILQPPCSRTWTYENATVTGTGSLNLTTLTWDLTSTAVLRNPTGPGTSNVIRVVKAKVSVLSSFRQPLNAQAWNYIYSTKTGDPDGCDQELHNSVVIAAPMYVEGNLCTYNSSSFAPASGPPYPSPAVNLVVKGSVTTNNSSTVGTSAAPISSAYIAGGCNGHVSCQWNGGGDRVFASTVSTMPPGIDPPTADFDYWYQNASPGPRHPCTTVSGIPPVFENEVVNATRNNSIPVPVDLTPALSYTCQTANGELSWNALTKTLIIRGAIYIDGSVVITNQAANDYNGQASLYVSGTFTINQSAQLCGGVVNGACDFGAWNPNTEMLIVAAAGTAGGNGDYGVTLANSSRFQGGIWATHAVSIGNSAEQEGPLIASDVDFNNSSTAKPFPLITSVPLGTPGQPNVYADPQRPVVSAG